jgi:hypothetical protein
MQELAAHLHTTVPKLDYGRVASQDAEMEYRFLAVAASMRRPVSVKEKIS